MHMQTKRTNAVKEVEGVWVDIGDGGRLKIARANNLAYLAMYREKTKPYWDSLNTDTLPLAEHIRIENECMAATILVDWEGIEDGNPAQPVAYSKEKALEFLAIPDFRELVTRLSRQQYRYRERDLEVAEKN